VVSAVPDSPVCGDGIVCGSDAINTCDDGNVDNSDGCSSTCTTEAGYYCGSAEPSVCRRLDSLSNDPVTVAGNLKTELNGGWQRRAELVNGKPSWSKGVYFLYSADTDWGSRWYFDDDLDPATIWSFVSSTADLPHRLQARGGRPSMAPFRTIPGSRLKCFAALATRG
jgi:cysteine-rich repeat protein